MTKSQSSSLILLLSGLFQWLNPVDAILRGLVLRSIPAFSTVLLSVVLTSNVVYGEDWPQFRGPTGQGLSNAVGVPTEFSPTKHVAWDTEIPGKGWSSPVLVGDRVFVTTAVPEREEKVSAEGRFTKKVATPYSLRAICIDRETGSVMWNVEVAEVPANTSIHPKNSHASPTPVVNAGRVFVHFGAFGTAALDFEGNVIWKKQIEYDPVHGSGSSPIVSDGKIIINCDGRSDPFVIALNASDGSESWRTARPDFQGLRFSFSTPLAIEFSGESQIVSPGSHGVCSYHPHTGEQLWVVRYPGKWSVVPRPVFADGFVLVCTGYEGPAELLAIRPDGRGDITDSNVIWRQKKFIPHNPSPIVFGKHVFLVDDDGIASCRSLENGEVVWKKRLGGNYSASPVLAEGRIYFLSEDGTCTIVRASTQFEKIAEIELNERTFASPVPVDGGLIVRTEHRLYCFKQP